MTVRFKLGSKELLWGELAGEVVPKFQDGDMLIFNGSTKTFSKGIYVPPESGNTSRIGPQIFQFTSTEYPYPAGV